MATKDGFFLPLDAMAKLLDLTTRRVQQLASEGVIPKSVRGKYELVPSVQGYVKYLRARSLGIELGSEAFTQQRARLTKSRADMAEFEQAKMLGQYVHVDEVRTSWLAIVQVARLRLLAIPAKIGARILLLKKPVAAQELMMREICEALDELSKFTVQPASVTVQSADGGAVNGHAESVGTSASADSGAMV